MGYLKKSVKHVFVTYTLYSIMFCLHSPIEASRDLSMVILMNNKIYTVLVPALNLV